MNKTMINYKKDFLKQFSIDKYEKLFKKYNGSAEMYFINVFYNTPMNYNVLKRYYKADCVDCAVADFQDELINVIHKKLHLPLI